MKVCWVSNYFSPYKLKLFNEIGKHIELTAVFLPGTDDNNRNDEWKLTEGLSFKSYIIGSDYYSLINRLAKENDILVDSMYSTKYGILAVNAFKRRHKKIIMDSDGGIPIDRGFIMNKAISFFMKRHDYFFSPSKQSNYYFEFYGVDPEKILLYRFTSLMEKEINDHKVLRNSKEEFRKELGIDVKFTILNVGRPIEVKGFDILLDAYMNTGLTDKINLYIVGGKPQEHIQKIVDDNKLDNVHFIDLLPTEELNKYYAASDTLIFTSRGDVWGLVVEEAMSFGLPVIASNKNGAGNHFKTLGNNTMICELNDINAYSDYIKQLYSDSKLLEELSLKSFDIVKDYTIENSARDIIGNLNKV